MNARENELNDLNLQQRNILLNFSEITQLTDYNLCRSILFQNNWNLENSIENFINNKNNPTPNPTNTILNNNQINGSNGSSSYQSNRRGGIEEEEEHLNIIQRQGIDQSQSHLFDFLFTPLRWLFRIYPESLNPDEDIIKFVNDFKTQYGDNTPQFRNVSYNQAVVSANREVKFLIVYLHSPLHEDTPKFCRYEIFSFIYSFINSFYSLILDKFYVLKELLAF